MDKTLLKTNGSQALVELIRRLISEVNTSIPGQIISFDVINQTATIRPCIRSATIDQAGEKTFTTLPEIFLCPVWFPYSTTSGFCLTYPINPGDQCLILFSQRSFDKWLAYGSYQDPTEEGIPRTHAFTDAIAFVGLIPNINKIPGFQSDGIEIRNFARNSYTKVTDATIEEKTTNFDGEYFANQKIKAQKQQIDVTTDSTEKINGKCSQEVVGDKEVKVGANLTEEISGNASKNVSGSDTEEISGNKTIQAPQVSLKGITSIEGSLLTSPGSGGGELGLTTSVTIVGVTLRFVNGILVQVS